MLDPLNALEVFLDPHADAFLDFFGRGTEIRHGDADERYIDIGKRFHRHRRQADEASENNQAHEQVGCDMVVGEPGDNRFHDDATPRPSVTGWTSMPSTAFDRVDRQMISPRWNPETT